MLIKRLMENQKKLYQSQTDFYTPDGLHVYFKEPIDNDKVDAESVVSKIEHALPPHLRTEIEMIVFGQFDEFQDRAINAFYDSGTLYVSNIQEDNKDLYDDIVHEISHSLEAAYGYEIYGDQKVKDEFVRKREFMHDILWSAGYKVPKSFFMDTEYSKEFDMFLYDKIGYGTLSSLLVGLFINPYAATSLREYFATGFTDYYTNLDHKTLQKVSPELYKKIILLQDAKNLDRD
jgi:hypothetical protein